MKRSIAGAVVAALTASAFTMSSPAGAKPAPVKVAAIQAPWGFVNAREVKPPVGTACVTVPVVVDVRNGSGFPWTGIIISLRDEFANTVGYQEFRFNQPLSQPAPLGKNATTLEVCGSAHNWTLPPNGVRGVKLAPYVKGATYFLGVRNWADSSGLTYENATYRFLK